MDDLNDFRQRCIDFMESQPAPAGAPTFEESCAFHAAASAAGVGAGSAGALVGVCGMLTTRSGARSKRITR